MKKTWFLVLLAAVGLSGCQILLDTYVYFYGFSEDRTFTNLAAYSTSVFDHVKEADTDGSLMFEGGEMTIRVPEAALWQNGVWNESYKRFQTAETAYYTSQDENAVAPKIRQTHVLSIRCDPIKPEPTTFYPQQTQDSFYYTEISCPKAPNVIVGIKIKRPKKWGGEIEYQLSVLIKNSAGKNILVGSSSPEPLNEWAKTEAH